MSKTQYVTQQEIHNHLAGEIVRQIVRTPLDAGGQFTDVLVILESVVIGVMLVGVRLGGDERVLDVLVKGVKKRLAELRLGDTKPEGTG